MLPHQLLLHVSGKGRKQRLVPLPRDWIALLRVYLQSWPQSRGSNPHFLCGQPDHENKRLTVAAIDYLVRQHAKAAGLTRLR